MFGSLGEGYGSVDIKTGANIKVRTEGISTHGQLPEGMVYCN